jgi:hypothetical protein
MHRRPKALTAASINLNDFLQRYAVKHQEPIRLGITYAAFLPKFPIESWPLGISCAISEVQRAVAGRAKAICTVGRVLRLLDSMKGPTLSAGMGSANKYP